MVCLRLGLVRRNVTETLKRLSWTHVLSATDEVIGGRPYHRLSVSAANKWACSLQHRHPLTGVVRRQVGYLQRNHASAGASTESPSRISSHFLVYEKWAWG